MARSKGDDELTRLAVDHRRALAQAVGEHPAVEREEQRGQKADGDGQAKRHRASW